MENKKPQAGFNDLKIRSQFMENKKITEKREGLENILYLEIKFTKNTKFKFGVYSEGMFFYYATYRKKSFELSFFAKKDCSELFPTEKLSEILNIINYKKYFDLLVF